MEKWTVKNLEVLDLALPDEVMKYKMAGNYTAAEQAIDRWLARPVTGEMKKRLELERFFLGRMRVEFPHTARALVEILKEKLVDFSEEELQQLDEAGLAEWILLDGEKHYVINADENILRLKDTDTANVEQLNQMIAQMKKDGKATRIFRMRASVQLKDEEFIPGMRLKVHLPIPAVLHQIKSVTLLGYTESVSTIDPEDALFRTICFEETVVENHPFYVEYEYETEIDYVDMYHARSETKAGEEFPEELKQYTEEQLPHIRFSHDLRVLAAEITEGLTDPVAKARAIYDYITCNVKYSYMREYFLIEDIPQYCARNLRGDCGVQALLFITLCRICGIPAKWQSGLYTAPYHIGNHDWALFYTEPYGWRYADNSFGGSAYRMGNEERRQFYFGNLEPWRMAANNAFMQDYKNPKQYPPADPYDSQSGEIESETQSYRSEQMIVCREEMNS